ncbi:MAG: protein kinase [Gemmatimonadetes bacterium]|nr:protein kinase [Gemmatimonadota bacterium]
MDLRDQLQAHLGDAFRIERELGGGGMSRVFLATEVRLARMVAIKVLSPELAQGINAERFEREILLAASLQQANIVPVLAAGDVAGLPYFTMPFVEGESLRTRIRGGGMPIADVIAILRDVTKALAYAHTRGIVHRDIKPDNVLLSGGTAVVTDFGIAKALSASRAEVAGGTLTSVGTSIGTPAYMAPEQVAGDPTIDHRVDLYALGCMAYELLTGASPFADRTPQRMLAAHLSETPPLATQKRSDCPPALAALVKQLLEKDPADRVNNATEVLRTLDEVTTASSSSSPTMALSGPGSFGKAFGLYVMATVAVAIVAKAAVVAIGLPEWTYPGAVGLMLLGLPMLLLTGYAKSVARRSARATPTLTPGGTMVGRAPSGTLATIALKANPHLSWRRNLRYGMVTMGSFVLLVIGYMVTRQMGIGPAASLFASGTLAAQDKVLLADFTTTGGDSTLAPIVQAAVRAAMSQSRAVTVLSPSDVAAELVRMQRPDSTPLDLATAKAVATRAGAKAILGGRLAAAGPGYLVSIELTSTAQGTVLASYQGTADGVKDLLNVVDDLTRKLRGKLGESLKEVQNAVPLERATTANLEALRKYTEATRANDVESDFDRAVTLLREAIALDSTFALAYRKLNAALTNSGASQIARDSALERAARYADRLPPLEKNLVLGAFNQGHSTLGDRGKALTAYSAAITIDSTQTAPLNQLSLLYRSREQYDSALRYTERQFRIAPNGRNAGKYANSLLEVGRYDDAERFIDSIRKVSPAAIEEFNIIGAVGLAAFVRGDIDSAKRVMERVARSTSVPEQMGAQAILADVALTQGQLAAFRSHAGSLDAILAARGIPNALDGYVEAATNIFAGLQLPQSVAQFDKIVASSQWTAIPAVDRPWGTTIRLYAMANAPARGRALLARMMTDRPGAATSRSLQPEIAWLEAELLLAEGKPTEAIAKFRAAMVASDGAPSGLTATGSFGIARSFDKAKQPDSAMVYFERYLSVEPAVRFGGINDPFALAATEKRLGELYDAKGERATALKHYEAFATQWKDADAELQPAVVSVRKRIEELKRLGG